MFQRKTGGKAYDSKNNSLSQSHRLKDTDLQLKKIKFNMWIRRDTLKRKNMGIQGWKNIFHTNMNQKKTVIQLR